MKKSKIETVQKQTLYRINQSIKTWRNALSYAENIIAPNRVELYRLYKDVEDTYQILSSVELIKDILKSKQFEIVKKSGKVDNLANELFHQKWFETVVDIFVDTIMYGHSIIKIDNIADNKVNISLFEREYVLPKKNLIKDALYSQTGLDYTKPEIYKYIFEVGDRKSFGLYAKLAPAAIYIKNAQGFWGEVQEVIGFPTIIAKTASTEDEAKQQLAGWVKELGRRSTAVIPMEDTIEFIEPSSTDLYSVYLEMIKYLQANISKVILGATEAVDGGSGGSEARAKVHNEQMELKLNSILRSLKHFIDDEIIDKLSKLGIISNGLQCNFLDVTDLDSLVDLHTKISKILVDGQINREFIKKTYNIELEEQTDDSGSSVQPSETGTSE